MIRAWPFNFAIVSIISRLNPPKPIEPTVTTLLRRYGLRITYNPSSYIGMHLYYRGSFEEVILRTMERVCRSGSTFIDVGANVGQHTIVAAKLVGPSGQVLAFEPQSSARHQAQLNVDQNGFSNVTLFSCALGRQQRTSTLYSLDSTNDGMATLASTVDGVASETIDVETLDEVMRDRRATDVVLKIDVEGGEMDVLSGASRFIAEKAPVAIFVECIDTYLRRFGSTRDDLYAWLEAAGYQVYVLNLGRWVRTSSSKSKDGDLMAIRAQGN